MDAECCCADEDDVTDFDALHSRVNDHSAFAYAFDLLSVEDTDIRGLPLVERRKQLAKILRKAKPGIRLSEHIDADGVTVFDHACKLGLEAIVCKRAMRLPLWTRPDMDQGEEQESTRLHPRTGGDVLNQEGRQLRRLSAILV
jgi:hypothetical protein